MPGIFRKQRFACGGCGRAKVAKVTVPPEEARDALAPPEGWFVVNMTAQDPTWGAIAGISVFTCSEQCGQALSSGNGAAAAFMTNFKAFLAGQGATQAQTEVVSADEEEDEEEEPQYVDEPN